ncbi:hypothetical protein HYDPIDRAFT_115639 [Hydnomerulius pinastri MD-312]|uniref:Uncharacterized protein n=1 Tax=Hydnomerulius pinastri MD-312 TaxID=994086 RepID=A0A0C9VUR0_9AGAM|nr:hypothetical protein HYDPIDRAFT_115639 [Hydnomerulius pinastri MD-312]
MSKRIPRHPPHAETLGGAHTPRCQTDWCKLSAQVNRSRASKLRKMCGIISRRILMLIDTALRSSLGSNLSPLEVSEEFREDPRRCVFMPRSHPHELALSAFGSLNPTDTVFL